MEIQVKNLGMIKEGKVALNGLTVIAGSNDTGKSTIGKILFALTKARNIIVKNKGKDSFKTLATWINLVFDGNATIGKSEVKIVDSKTSQIKFELNFKDENRKNFIEKFYHDHKFEFFKDATFIHTPIVFDLSSFFVKIQNIKNNIEMYDMFSGSAKKTKMDFGFSYPVTLWDLHTKIYQDNQFAIKNTTLLDEIKNTISGQIKKQNGKFIYSKNIDDENMDIDITNTAFGIKSFGILQLLADNGFLHNKNILIIDEPENHLHPEWQIAYAKVLIKLVKNGIRVLINTHSPYMIQAIKKFSDEDNEIKDKTNFYLAQMLSPGHQSEIVDKTSDLNAIFAKLAKPLHDITWG